MGVTMTDYRFGLLTGAIGAWGIYAILEGLEILAFGGLVIQWNTRTAIISVLNGLVLIGLAIYLYRWFVSITNVVKSETEVSD